MGLKFFFIISIVYAIGVLTPCSADTAKHSMSKQNNSVNTNIATIPGGNYDGSTEGGVNRWSLSKMPLKVFIKPGTGVPGYYDGLMVDLKKCFQEWASASKGKIQFTFSDDASTSDIRCLWTNDANLMVIKDEGGQCHMVVNREGLAKADIMLLTVSLIDKKPLSFEELRGSFARDWPRSWLGWTQS
jgi:hypothetical protein